MIRLYCTSYAVVLPTFLLLTVVGSRRGGTIMDFTDGGLAIQRLRVQHAMTQEQLAELTDTTPNSISRIERGVFAPSLETLIKICNALETSSATILAAYIKADSEQRWCDLSQRMQSFDLKKQSSLAAIMDFMSDII